MGILARLLGWVWRRWADYNLVVALLDVLDFKTGLTALIGGLLMTIFGATNMGWSPQGVVLAALVAAACIALIVIAIRLILGGVRPKEGQGASKDNPDKFTGFSVVNGRLIQPPTKPASDPFSKAFNVSRIWFQNPDLSSKGLIYINIDVFNGNNEEIFLKGITGTVSLKFKGPPARTSTPIERGKLITPCFSSPRQNHFGALQAFYLILEQQVPQKLADEFLNWVDNTSYIFDFENLNIVAQGVDSKKEVRLLLWDQAELPKNFWGRTALRVAIIRPDRPLNMPTGQ
jgi:hypothetical protein